MAVAIDVTSQWVFSHANVASIATASFTPPAGSRLWAFSGWDITSTATVTITSSGTSGLTWHQLDASQGGQVLWWADIPGGGWTGTVTATPDNLPQFPGGALYAMVVTGGEAIPGGAHFTTGTSGMVSPVSQAITTTGTQSLLVSGVSNWVGGQFTNTGPNAANQTFLQDDYFASNYQHTVFRRNGLVNAGTYTMDVSSGTGANGFNIVEIRAGAAGPTSHPRWGRVAI